MSVLILNASPHPRGPTAVILHAVESGARDNNDVEWVDVNHLDMVPCIGCLRCRPDGECVQPEDDAHRVGRRIQEADSLVVGTPTYWGNMTGPLKLLFDRNVPVFLGEGKGRARQRGKTAAIIVTCDTSWPISQLSSQGGGAIRAVRTVLASAGFRIVGSLIYPCARGQHDVPPSVLHRAIELGRRL